MKNTEKKARVNAWLQPQMIAKMESLISLHSMKNHTEFIEMAVDFFIGYLSTQDATTFLSKVLVGAIDGTMKQTENRHSNNLFRLSVEMSMMMNLIAVGMEVEDEQVQKLRGRCIREIKNNKGKITVEDAIEYQRSDD